MTKVLVLSCALVSAACAERELTVRFFRSDTYTFSSSEQRAIEQVARAALREVRPLLPALPPTIELTVRPGEDVIDETGETASAMAPNGIMWTVHPSRHGGVAAITQRWLRATLFHELHHLARSAHVNELRTIADYALYEGMATAFERDFAGVETPWGAYPPDVDQWAIEVLHLPEDASRREWIYLHPDGRQWIGMKVGTYWVDQAMAKSKRSSADLAATPTRELLALLEE